MINHDVCELIIIALWMILIIIVFFTITGSGAKRDKNPTIRVACTNCSHAVHTVHITVYVHVYSHISA